MRVLRIACVFLVVAACGGGKSPSASTTTPSTVPVTEGATTTLPALHFKQAEEATSHLVDAWHAGDKAAAGQAASAEAVAALFARAPIHLAFNGCEHALTPDAPVDCASAYNKDLLLMHVVKTNGDWVVTTIEFAS